MLILKCLKIYNIFGTQYLIELVASQMKVSPEPMDTKRELTLHKHSFAVSLT